MTTAEGAIRESQRPGDEVLVSADDDVTPAVSVVMPTMNEEQGVSTCITDIKRAFAELGVTGEIIISDESTDRTPDIARERGARVVSPDQQGYGYAYRYAFERARGEYIVMGDADTTYDFTEIPRLLEQIQHGDADIVMGSRLRGEIKSGAMPALHQHIGNPLLTRFLNLFYGAGVSDAHSGFRVFSRDALDALELETTGMEFASEMVIEAAEQGLTIEEVPITYHERAGEATLESFTDGWRHVKFMFVNAPGHLFSIPGLVLGLLGAIILTLGFFGASIFGQPIGVHSMFAGSLLLMVGYQIGSFGLLTDLAADPIRSPTDPLTQWVETNFTLQRGVTLGTTLFVVGGTTAAYLLFEWYASGYTNLPSLPADLVAVTCLVLGIQTVFLSFFGSILVERA